MTMKFWILLEILVITLIHIFLGVSFYHAICHTKNQNVRKYLCDVVSRAETIRNTLSFKSVTSFYLMCAPNSSVPNHSHRTTNQIVTYFEYLDMEKPLLLEFENGKTIPIENKTVIVQSGKPVNHWVVNDTNALLSSINFEKSDNDVDMDIPSSWIHVDFR